MAEIDEVQFPADISKGSSGGPVRRTSITELGNGFEERNTPTADSIHRYDAGLGLRSLDDLADVKAFFEARLGQLYGFRWKDWADYKSCRLKNTVGATDQLLGETAPSRLSFQLLKHYTSGDRTYTRRITKPVQGSVTCAVDGAGIAEGDDFIVDYSSGVVSLTRVFPEGQNVTAGFEFDVPARFDTDMLDINIDAFMAGSVPNIEIVELKVPIQTDTTLLESQALYEWLTRVDINTAVNINWNTVWS